MSHLLISSLDRNPLWLSSTGQLSFGTRHECADFRLPSHFLMAYTCRLMTRIHYGRSMPSRRPKILTITWRYMDAVLWYLDTVYNWRIRVRSIHLYGWAIYLHACIANELLEALWETKLHGLFGCTFPRNTQYGALISSAYTNSTPWNGNVAFKSLWSTRKT